MTASLTCKRCGSAVTLDTPEKLALLAKHGAVVWCDGCRVPLAGLKTALQYLERKG